MQRNVTQWQFFKWFLKRLPVMPTFSICCYILVFKELGTLLKSDLFFQKWRGLKSLLFERKKLMQFFWEEKTYHAASHGHREPFSHFKFFKVHLFHKVQLSVKTTHFLWAHTCTVFQFFLEKKNCVTHFHGHFNKSRTVLLTIQGLAGNFSASLFQNQSMIQW